MTDDQKLKEKKEEETKTDKSKSEKSKTEKSQSEKSKTEKSQSEKSKTEKSQSETTKSVKSKSNEKTDKSKSDKTNTSKSDNMKSQVSKRKKRCPPTLNCGKDPRMPMSSKSSAVEKKEKDDKAKKWGIDAKRAISISSDVLPIPDEVKTNMADFVVLVGEAGFPGLLSCYNEVIKNYDPPNELSATTAFHESKNAKMNKSRDVPCLDHSRVRIEVQVPPLNNYYHANTVRIDGVNRNYVLAQAPFTEGQIDDFWRMAFTSNTTTIVNLCKTEGSGPNVALPFWPQEVGFENYGVTVVETKSINHHKDTSLTLNVLEVMPDGYSQPNLIRLIHAPDVWSDNPQPDIADVARLYRVIQGVHKSETYPVLIVDSSGVGRSAFVLLLDLYLQVLLTPANQIQLPELCKKIREQRACALQTEHHFIYAIVSILKVIQTIYGVGVESIAKALDDFKKFEPSLNDSNAAAATATDNSVNTAASASTSGQDNAEKKTVAVTGSAP